MITQGNRNMAFWTRQRKQNFKVSEKLFKFTEKKKYASAQGS